MAGSEDWGDLERLPAPKSQLPKLALLGCGCLVPVLALVGLLGWAWQVAERGQDEEAQWAALQEVLPADAPPAGYALRFGFQPGWMDWLVDTQAWVFKPEGAETETARQQAWILLRSNEDLSLMLDTANEDVEPWTPPGADAPLQTLAVQGRELRVARAGGQSSAWPWGEEAAEEGETALVVELVPHAAGESSLVLLVTGAAIDALTPEEVRAFLAPFHVGPERQAPPAESAQRVQPGQDGGAAEDGP